MASQLPLFEITTMETSGDVPKYVLLHNAIIRGAHSLSETAQKLTALAMAMLPSDLSSLTATFNFKDFQNAIGTGKGGEQHKLFVEAVDECLECKISIETGVNKRGVKSWLKFMWFSQAEYDSVTGIAKITFAPKLAEFLAAMKWLYSKINLKDIGNLQSRFAIRLFEIAISYRSMAGCDGNQENAWYFERGFPDEMRLIMGVDEKAYKDKHVLKQKIVDNPIKGINEAGLGLEIKPTTIKQGRQVIAIRFNCTSAPRTPKGTGRKRLKAELHQEEQDLQRLKELQPPGIRGAISGHYGQPFSVSEKAKAHRNLR